MGQKRNNGKNKKKDNNQKKKKNDNDKKKHLDPSSSITYDDYLARYQAVDAVYEAKVPKGTSEDDALLILIKELNLDTPTVVSVVKNLRYYEKQRAMDMDLLPSQGKSKKDNNKKGKEKMLASDSSLNTLDVAYEQGFNQEILDSVIACQSEEEGMRFLKRILHLSKPDFASIIKVLLEDKAALDATTQSTMLEASEHTLDMDHEKGFSQETLGRVIACKTKEDGMLFLKDVLNLELPDAAKIMKVLLEDNREAAALEATKHYDDPRDKGKGLAESGSSSDKKDGSASAHPGKSDVKNMLLVNKFLSRLPARLDDQVSSLSTEDKEVLAYIITSGDVFGKRPGDHKPSFNCRCMSCYIFYWARWNSCTTSQTVGEIIEAYDKETQYEPEE